MSGIRVLDLEELRQRLDNDEELVAEIVELFLDDTPRQIAALEDALARGDGEVVRERAHTLKGAAANMGAAELRETAGRMEEAARNGRLAEATELADRIHRDFARLREALASP